MAQDVVHATLVDHLDAFQRRFERRSELDIAGGKRRGRAAREAAIAEQQSEPVGIERDVLRRE
jgi:hypothetical protein